MKKILIIATVSMCLLLSFNLKKENMETKKIKDSIIKNYVNGAFNSTNINGFNTIMHPEFSIINIQEDGSFYLFTKDMWEKALKERLADPNFDYSTIAFTPHFRNIDIVEDKASVALDLFLDDKKVYSEFWLMAKINDEWQFVSKVFHEHK